MMVTEALHSTLATVAELVQAAQLGDRGKETE